MTKPTKTKETGSIIAPPTFVQASAQFDPDYRLRPKIGEAWFGSGKEPTGVQQSSGGGGRACMRNNITNITVIPGLGIFDGDVAAGADLGKTGAAFRQVDFL